MAFVVSNGLPTVAYQPWLELYRRPFQPYTRNITSCWLGVIRLDCWSQWTDGLRDVH